MMKGSNLTGSPCVRPEAVGAGTSRRQLLTTFALAASLAPAVMLGSLSPANAQADDWPNRPVTVVVPFAAGGNTDLMARMASQQLSETFKQNFVVENRLGAGGAIAAQYVRQQPADGYTLFFAAAPQIAVLPKIQKVNYDPHKDFAPVSVFGTGPFILAIRGDIPAKTVPEFVEYAKKNKMTYGSGGTGTVGHLSGALFVARAGFDAVHAPFRGGAPALNALLGGQVDMYFGNASEIIPHADGGKIRVLAVAADKPMEQLPDTPIVSEFYPEFSLNAWNGFVVRSGTPQAIIDKVAKAVMAAAKDPENVARLNKLGIQANGTTPEEMAAQIKREQPHFDTAIKAANLKPAE